MIWDIYSTRININGNTQKEIQANAIKDSILNNFVNNPSFFLVKINGVDREVNIVEESSLIKNPNRKRLLCKPDETINIGDIVRFDISDWICVNNNTTSEVYDVGIIEKCNNTLNFYDQNHILYQIPCIISKSLTLNTEENKYITTVDNEFYLTVPNNFTTQQIKVNDIYKIGNYNYQIASVPDDISQQGLLIFKVKYSEEKQIIPVYSIEILNGSEVNIQENSTLQLNIQVFADNQLISPTPSLVYISNNEEVCVVDENGLITGLGIGDCVVSVSLESNNSVSQNINISVIELPQENYTYEIQGNSEIYRGYSGNYKAFKYLNGILVEGAEFTFSIISDSVPEISYNLEVISGNECKITAKQSVYTIVLRATDNNGKFVEKSIKLMNLF